MVYVKGGSRAAAPNGSATYTYTHLSNFLYLKAGGRGGVGEAEGGERGENSPNDRWNNIAEVIDPFWTAAQKSS